MLSFRSGRDLGISGGFEDLGFETPAVVVDVALEGLLLLMLLLLLLLLTLLVLLTLPVLPLQMLLLLLLREDFLLNLFLMFLLSSKRLTCKTGNFLCKHGSHFSYRNIFLTSQVAITLLVSLV